MDKESACSATGTVDSGSIPGLGRVPRGGKWQQTTVFLAEKIPRAEEPGGLQSKGLQRLGHDWVTKHEKKKKHRFHSSFSSLQSSPCFKNSLCTQDVDGHSRGWARTHFWVLLFHFSFYPFSLRPSLPLTPLPLPCPCPAFSISLSFSIPSFLSGAEVFICVKCNLVGKIGDFIFLTENITYLINIAPHKSKGVIYQKEYLVNILHSSSLPQSAHFPPHSPVLLSVSCVDLIYLLFSLSVMSSSLWPHGLQHARLPCPSPSPGICSNSCPLH